MESMEVTVAERGQIVIPKQARDAMGITPGTRLELRVVEGQLIVTKRVSLNLDKWFGSAPDDGLTTEQALQELRGRPVPWTGSVRDQRIHASPQAEALAELEKANLPGGRPAFPRDGAPQATRKGSVARKTGKAATTGRTAKRRA